MEEGSSFISFLILTVDRFNTHDKTYRGIFFNDQTLNFGFF